MKTIELFCASPASTAICSSMDQRAIVRPIERRLGETVPKSRTNGGAPCSSQLPLSPRVKTSSRSNNYYYKQIESRRKSSADVDDMARLQRLQISSSRYLLSHDKPHMMDFDNNNNNNNTERAVICSQPLKENNYRRLSTSDTYPVFRSLSSTRANYKSPLNKSSLDEKTSSLPLMRHDHHLNVDKVSSKSNRQVVELRVSIHCKGCEGKLRKHISRMEGVTSYSIDLATKKVTVIGDVTPLGVLTSISKVKNAQFWPSPTSSSSSSTSSLSSSPRISLKR